MKHACLWFYLLQNYTNINIHDFSQRLNCTETYINLMCKICLNDNWKAQHVSKTVKRLSESLLLIVAPFHISGMSPSWSWWTISLNSTIRRPSTIQSSLSSGSVELLKGIKLLKIAAFLVNFPSLVRNIFYFLYGQSQIGSAPKSSWRQKQKIILRAMHAFTFAPRLRPAKNARGIACSRVLAELFLVCSALWHRCW